MAKEIDRNSPYGEVYGLPGVCYEQNGLFYNRGGQLVELETVEHINDEPTPPSPRDDTPIRVAEVVESKEEPKKEQSSFDSMPTKELKALLSVYGGVWTTRSDAIKFLKGQ